MKRLFLILGAMLLTVSATFAQAKISPEKAEKIFASKVAYMKNALKMSDEQTVKFTPIYKDFCTEIHKIARPARKKEFSDCDDAAKSISEHLEYQKTIIEVQKKYVVKLKDVLDKNQLPKFLPSERSMQHKFRATKLRGMKNKHKHHRHHRPHRHQRHQRHHDMACPCPECPNTAK